MNADLRIGDAEREAAITALGEHFAAGRIDKDEYDERSSVAWASKTASDLTPLFADLPNLHSSTTKADGATSRSADRATSAPTRRPSPGWYRVARFALVPLVIVLAVLSLIPWFVVAVAAWLAWIGLSRCAWGPRRSWHYRTGAYGRRGRW